MKAFSEKVRTNKSKDIALEFLAVAFLATAGIWVKLSTLPPIATGFYRVLFSIPLLLPLAYKDLKQLSKRDVLILLFAGAFLAGDIALWNLSYPLLFMRKEGRTWQPHISKPIISAKAKR